jgi:hypothetical protein
MKLILHEDEAWPIYSLVTVGYGRKVEVPSYFLDRYEKAAEEWAFVQAFLEVVWQSTAGQKSQQWKSDAISPSTNGT